MKRLMPFFLSALATLAAAAWLFAKPPAAVPLWEWVNGAVTPADPAAPVVMGTAYLELTADTTLTDNQVQRYVITNRGQSTEQYTKLPTYEGVCEVSLEVVTASQEWDILPPTGEQLKFDGSDLTANWEIQLDTTQGDALACRRIRTGASTYQWWCRTIQGTHTGQAAD